MPILPAFSSVIMSVSSLASSIHLIRESAVAGPAEQIGSPLMVIGCVMVTLTGPWF
jgi:hypothetical protein